MNWIYLSPHFDDAVFSCGGLIWQQVQLNQTVQIWTICAGEIPSGTLSAFAEELHQRWDAGRDAVVLRRLEDERACARLSAEKTHFPIPDCIYRRAGENYWNQNPGKSREKDLTSQPLYTSDEAIFGPVHPSEFDLVQRLRRQMEKAIPPDGMLVCPLTVGGHVDHRLTRAAADALGKPIWYYPDFPYILENPGQHEDLTSKNMECWRFEISKAGIEAWIDAAAAYQSQISTFWAGTDAMGRVLERYITQSGGLRLYKWKV